MFSGGYQGDVYLLLKLLLPGVVKTVYNLNNKQLVKLFSQVGNWKWSGAWVCSSLLLPWLWQLVAVSCPSRLHCSAPQCYCSSMAAQSRYSYMCWIASRNWIWGCTSGRVEVPCIYLHARWELPWATQVFVVVLILDLRGLSAAQGDLRMNWVQDCLLLHV